MGVADGLVSAVSVRVSTEPAGGDKPPTGWRAPTTARGTMALMIGPNSEYHPARCGWLADPAPPAPQSSHSAFRTRQHVACACGGKRPTRSAIEKAADQKPVKVDWRPVKADRRPVPSDTRKSAALLGDELFYSIALCTVLAIAAALRENRGTTTLFAPQPQSARVRGHQSGGAGQFSRRICGD